MKRQHLFRFALMALLSGGSALLAEDDNIFKSGDEMVARTSKSLVSIFARPEGEKLAYSGYVKRKAGSGTGFFIDRNGLIATAYHVVDHCKKVSVKLADQKQYEADVVGFDDMIDVALLKLGVAMPEGLDFLEWGDSEQVKVGQRVIAAGDPGRLRATITSGIVSALGRVVPLSPVQSFIQTDAPINPGNSGGPLMNRDGKVVGINDAVSGDLQNIGYAIPSKISRRTLESIAAGERYRYPFLGLSVMEEDPFVKDMGYQSGSGQGLIVVGVSEDSPAKTAGVEYGDIWVHLNDAPVRSFAEAFQATDGKSPGDSVEIKVLRKSASLAFKVVLVERPSVPIFNFENFSRVNWGFEIKKDLRYVNEEGPVYQVGKIFAWAEKKKDYFIKEGFWILSVSPGKKDGIPEQIRDDEQFISLTRENCLIDDDRIMSLLLNVSSDRKGPGSWAYLATKSYPIMY